ncbi:hypothetical protein COCNU_scaffold001409G000030 [Cocos nucifera]|nr:hypothetical protein [Cocos nucifera]
MIAGRLPLPARLPDPSATTVGPLLRLLLSSSHPNRNGPPLPPTNAADHLLLGQPPDLGTAAVGLVLRHAIATVVHAPLDPHVTIGSLLHHAGSRASEGRMEALRHLTVSALCATSPDLGAATIGLVLHRRIHAPRVGSLLHVRHRRRIQCYLGTRSHQTPSLALPPESTSPPATLLPPGEEDGCAAPLWIFRGNSSAFLISHLVAKNHTQSPGSATRLRIDSLSPAAANREEESGPCRLSEDNFSFVLPFDLPYLRWISVFMPPYQLLCKDPLTLLRLKEELGMPPSSLRT